MSPNSDDLLLHAISIIKRYGNISAAAKAEGINRTTLGARVGQARIRWPGCLPAGQRGGVPSGWALSTEKPRIRVKASAAAPEPPVPAAVEEETPKGDSMDTRRWQDLVSHLRRRVKDLEGSLIAESDWRAKMDRLSMATVEPPLWLPKPHINRGVSLTPILFTSDFQVGEVIRADELDGINEYNQDIFVTRYQAMIDKTIDLAEHSTGGTDFPGAIYLRGGDAISGEIHEELAETNDLSAVPAVKLLQRQEREGIRRLRDKFGRVRVISIPGNHGRTTKKSHSKGYTERSYETLLAWWLADGFGDDPNVTFWTPKSGDALFDCMGWWFLLSHGDRMGSRGGQGFIGPAATIARGHRKLYDNHTMTGRRVDCIFTGHMHTSLKLERGYANGALAGYSEYARDFRATPDAAKQWLLFSHQEHMVSHHFELQLSPQPRRTTSERFSD